TFIGYQILREFLAEKEGPVLRAVRATSLDAWLTAIAIFVVIMVVLYSTFFTNPYGIWDPRYSLLSPLRKDILGGVTYWQLQHTVDRGGQPWFYYLLVLPLYQQLAVVFGIAGALYALFHRTLFNTFLVWWAVGSLLLYSWAGEKMPWLSLHIALPFVLLAGLFAGHLLASRRTWVLLGAGSVFAALLALEVHTTFALNFRDGANPTEMLIYVQTSQDVPNVVSEINTLSHRVTGGTNLAIGLDNTDVGGWPFIWYLRDYPNVTLTPTFSGPTCGGQYCPVLLMLDPQYAKYGGQLAKRYVAQKYRWNWWFPEDYKVWFPDHVGTIAGAVTGRGALAADPIGNSTDWQHLWNWIVYRQPFGDRGARWLYVLVRRDLVPGAKYYSSRPLSGALPPAPASHVPILPATLNHAAGGGGLLDGPRGISTGRRGDLYVSDPPNHRVVVLSRAGRLIRSWGTVGTAPGQFNTLESPQDLAVAANGAVYVADTWNQRIQEFSATGTYLRQWGGGPIGSGPGQFYGPRSVAVGPNRRVYVADTGNERIQVFTPSGRYITSWGTRGSAEGQFMEPSSVAVASNGTVYVADFWNQRIQAFSPSGTFLRTWSVPDWTPHSYAEPYLSVSPVTGDVFATDPQQQRVLAWRADGRVLGAFGATKLALPVGISVGRDGRVAVSDATGGKVDVFTVRIKMR
ncbi:MAG: flippase activity-associated protein Agl23, partial [Chloroflexota bacterium]